MSLLNVWREWEIGSPPYILKGDDVLLSRAGADSRIAVNPSRESYTQRDDFGRPGDIRLHLNLIPIPFVGDLARARIVVLLLNPGLEPDDYFAEFTVPGFRDRLLDNLRQEFKHPRYPFVYLDPALSWHSGYRWWHGKFQGLIAALSATWGTTYADSRARFAQLLACIELVPYHSVNYRLSSAIRRELRSVRIAREYVHEVLWPRSQTGEILIIVTRHTAEWRLSESSHVIAYAGSETRAAHLTPASRGGRRILEFAREL